LSITDQQYTDWLASDDADPVILVEATHSGGTEYVASAPFISGATDTPADTSYSDVLIGEVEVENRLDAATVGDLLLVNDGELDGWLDYNWRGYALKVFLGDKAWSRADFRLVIDGINGGIEAPDDDRLEWVVLDRGENLRVNIGSDTTPIALGEVYNCKPVLIDAVNLKYKAHDGAVTALTVRDNGVVISPTEDLANGEFTLASQPAGQITCDVSQADKSAADIVDELCNRASIAVDSANLSAFANTDDLGVYIDEPTDLESVLSDVLASVGATYRFNTSGELQIFRLEAPGTATLTLTNDDVIERGLKLSATERPTEVFTLGYRKNWYQQSPDSLAGSLDADEKNDFEIEYLTVTKDNNLANNPLAQDDRVNTLIANQTDAQTECDRRASLRSVRRRVWRATCFLPASEVELGETVNLTYPALGWDSGKDAVVIGINRRVGKRRMELTLWA